MTISRSIWSAPEFASAKTAQLVLPSRARTCMRCTIPAGPGAVGPPSLDGRGEVDGGSIVGTLHRLARAGGSCAQRECQQSCRGKDDAQKAQDEDLPAPEPAPARLR